MQVNYLNFKTQEESTTELHSAIFTDDVREDILQKVVRWQLSKRRVGSHKTKTRSEVSGTTRKPWKQKGTGNARLGSLRAAQCRGGGIIFGPVVRDHSHKLTKKIKKLGLRMAITSRVNSNCFTIIDALELDAISTKELNNKFISKGKSILIIDGNNVDPIISKSLANIHNINILPTVGANVYDILKHEKLFITKSGMKSLEERLA